MAGWRHQLQPAGDERTPRQDSVVVMVWGIGKPIHNINVLIIKELLTRISHMRPSTMMYKKEPMAHCTYIWYCNVSEDLILIPYGTSPDLQLLLERFAADAFSGSGGGVLPQVEEFKYLGILFMNEGRRKRETDRWIGTVSAVKWVLYRSVVVKRELSQKAKLSINQSIYVPTLIYGHELWVMTERMRSRIQAAEMGFLRRVSGLSLRDGVRSSVIQEGLRVEPLHLHIKRS
ncbi:hypothetical protein CCH79_00019954 [Gambusia affinis]|uniref:Reverse transcriptase domain-containing protein n=1 Tax=Gambusia affinis TaxID=33528 RepID=A0A315VPB0_GAMAF|nr:hypothetical protein CCH79_00019954 [Gambusia affinis]